MSFLAQSLLSTRISLKEVRHMRGLRREVVEIERCYFLLAFFDRVVRRVNERVMGISEGISGLVVRR